MKALLLIDIQNDYFPNGKKELVGSEEAGKNAGIILHKFREAKLPIFHIQHISTKPDATFFIPGTEGIHIHSSVAPLTGEPIIEKHYPSSFRETLLLEELTNRNITNLFIAGMMTHMCIDTTVRAGCNLGYNCTLLHDACATCDISFNGKTTSASNVQISYMGALQGLFAKVIDTKTACTLV